MAVSPTRNLLLIKTLLVLFLGACKTQSGSVREDTQLPDPFVLKMDSSLVYRASFNYKANHFSGLTVLKKSGERAIRVVFLSEMGLTLMDVEITPEQFIVHKTFDFLDKKIIMSFIENDFRLMLMTDLLYNNKIKRKETHEGYTVYKVKGVLKVEYIMELDTNSISKAIRRGGFNSKKATVDYTYNSSGIPSKIFLQRTNVDLDLKLSLLKKM